MNESPISKKEGCAMKKDTVIPLRQLGSFEGLNSSREKDKLNVPPDTPSPAFDNNSCSLHKQILRIS